MIQKVEIIVTIVYWENLERTYCHPSAPHSDIPYGFIMQHSSYLDISHDSRLIGIPDKWKEKVFIQFTRPRNMSKWV